MRFTFFGGLLAATSAALDIHQLDQSPAVDEDHTILLEVEKVEAAIPVSERGSAWKGMTGSIKSV